MKPYDVYKNLHKDCWSVKDRTMGHVIRHERSVLLCDVSFIVGRKGRQRVIDSGRKNVHALFVVICVKMVLSGHSHKGK